MGRANGDLEIKLGKWIQDNEKGWIVFGQHPRSSIALIENLSSQGIENEDDLPVEIQDSINEHADHPQGLAVDDRSESSQNDTEPTDNGMYYYITCLVS